MSSIRNSAKAIIVESERLLAIRCLSWKQETYYILPGGGQEQGENLHEALRRECREEIGVEIAVGALRFVRDYIGRNHAFAEKHAGIHQVEFMFECRILDGTPVCGRQPDAAQTGVEWLPLASLEEMLFFPLALRSQLARKAPDAPIYLGDVN